MKAKIVIAVVALAGLVVFAFGYKGTPIVTNPPGEQATTTPPTVTTTPSTIPHFKILSPNGGEVWPMNSTKAIRWLQAGSSKVDISLLPYPYRAPYTITSGVEGNGGYIWYVGVTQVSDLGTGPMAGQYKVRVCTSNGTVCDTSDNYFTITSNNASSLQVISPNGGEVWALGSAHDITWRGSPTNSVTIKTTRTDQPCSAVCAPFFITEGPVGVPTNAGYTYHWTVGVTSGGVTLPVGQYQMEACTTDGTSCDTSNSYFTIIN